MNGRIKRTQTTNQKRESIKVHKEQSATPLKICHTHKHKPLSFLCEIDFKCISRSQRVKEKELLVLLVFFQRFFYHGHFCTKVKICENVVFCMWISQMLVPSFWFHQPCFHSTFQFALLEPLTACQCIQLVVFVCLDHFLGTWWGLSMQNFVFHTLKPSRNTAVLYQICRKASVYRYDDFID